MNENQYLPSDLAQYIAQTVTNIGTNSLGESRDPAAALLQSRKLLIGCNIGEDDATAQSHIRLALKTIHTVAAFAKTASHIDNETTELIFQTTVAAPCADLFKSGLMALVAIACNRGDLVDANFLTGFEAISKKSKSIVDDNLCIASPTITDNLETMDAWIRVAREAQKQAALTPDVTVTRVDDGAVLARIGARYNRTA